MRWTTTTVVFWADPAFPLKAMENRSDEINVCIACNQTCLDHVFKKQTASCLVNPRACHETEWLIEPAAYIKSECVVGAGPAGLAAELDAKRAIDQAADLISD